MLFMQIVFAFIISFSLAYALAALLDTRGPWGTTWSMGLVAFGFVVAAGLLIQPFGPELYGLYPAPFLVPALLFMLLFAAIPATVRSRQPTTEGSVTGDIAVGMTFWVMIIALAAVTILAVTTSTAGVV